MRKSILLLVVIALCVSCKNKVEQVPQQASDSTYVEPADTIPTEVEEEPQEVEEEPQEEESDADKTITIECHTYVLGTTYPAHIVLTPDGTAYGHALMHLENGKQEEQDLSGSWRTGSVSRGNSYITYYEIDVNDQEWYCTEKFDFIWRGNNSYSDMRNRNTEKAGIIDSVTKE